MLKEQGSSALDYFTAWFWRIRAFKCTNVWFMILITMVVFTSICRNSTWATNSGSKTTHALNQLNSMKIWFNWQLICEPRKRKNQRKGKKKRGRALRKKNSQMILYFSVYLTKSKSKSKLLMNFHLTLNALFFSPKTILICMMKLTRRR